MSSLSLSAALEEIGLESKEGKSPVPDVKKAEKPGPNDRAADGDVDARTAAVYEEHLRVRREEEVIEIRIEAVRGELRNLKAEKNRAMMELERIKSVPLQESHLLEMVTPDYGLIEGGLYVRVLSTINRELLKPGATIAVHRYSHSVVEALPDTGSAELSRKQTSERPNVPWASIGGYDVQKQELQEIVSSMQPRALCPNRN
jgi:26S proteasome regulatory subunit T3